MKIQKLLLLALPLTLTAGCVQSHQPAAVTYAPPGQVVVPAPTSDRRVVRVYTEPSPGLSATDDPDMPLANDIRAMVASDPALNAACRDVDIEVVRGHLTLRGTVTTEQQRKLIERRLATRPGVVSVDNRLVVSPY